MSEIGRRQEPPPSATAARMNENALRAIARSYREHFDATHPTEQDPSRGADLLEAWADEIGARGERVTPQPAGGGVEKLRLLDEERVRILETTLCCCGHSLYFHARGENICFANLPNNDNGYGCKCSEFVEAAGSPVPADPQTAFVGDHDEFVNELLAFAPEEWDCDEAAEAIVLHWLDHLMVETKRLGGCFYPRCQWSDREPCDHGYLATPAAVPTDPEEPRSDA